MLALFAFAMLPATLSAGTEKKKHAAGHETGQHAVSHPNAHPEAHSKQRDAEAKKRLAKDRKQQKKTEKALKNQNSHRVAAPSRLNRAARTETAANRADNPELATKPDQATASRVHAWVNSHKQPSAGQQTAASSDLSKAATSKTDVLAPAGNTNAEQNDSATGTSNPPPDDPQAESATPAVSDPVSVISVVRKSPGDRPQLPPVAELAAEPVILPTLYTRRGRLVVPPPLKGSHEILIRQNQVADDEGLDRIQNDNDLDRLRSAGLLIAIPSNAMLHVDERLPLNRRYCRPWTALFLDTLARQHYARFQSTLQLTSAVRTVEFQQQLILRNGNAAPAEGDTASPHLTGQAVDIGKKGLTMAEIAWLRGYLLPLVQQGKVDVEEEFQQSCFHISVYKKYMPKAGAGRRSIASTRNNGIGALATGLR